MAAHSCSLPKAVSVQSWPDPAGTGKQGEGKAWLKVLGAQNWSLETAYIKPGLLATCSDLILRLNTYVQVSLCSNDGYPETCNVDQTDLEQRSRDICLHRVLGL